MSQTSQMIDPNMKAGPSVKDVYGDRLPAIPDGWELDGPEYFRRVRPGSTTLVFRSDEPYIWGEHECESVHYRIHVRRKRSPIAASHSCTTTATVGEIYGGPVEIPEEYDYVDFRSARDSEEFISNRSQSILSGPSVDPRIIVRRKDGARG